MKTTKKTTKEEFKLLTNDERLEVIQDLDYRHDVVETLELLSSVPIETLDATLLVELARAYNNNGEYEAAMAVLDMIETEKRDALWYYRYAYSRAQLAEDVRYDFESESKQALFLMDKAVELAEDVKIIDWCIELILMSFSDLENVLEDNAEKYPLIHKKYHEFADENSQEMKRNKQRIYKKITVKDVLEESCDIVDPMWWTINIYDSYDAYLNSAESFTLEQRYLFAITWYFAEVNNGGHHQFFYNSTGIVWQDVLHGFRHFNMTEYADNLWKVVDYCGGAISFDREERWNMLKALEEKNENELFTVLDEADNFVYRYEGEESELTYIKANPEKFVFEGEYWGYLIQK